MAVNSTKSSRPETLSYYGECTYRLHDTLTHCIFFDFSDLFLEVIDVYSFVVLWYSTELVMESRILDHAKRQMVCRCYEPNSSGVTWISEHIQKNGEVLRGSA